MIDDLLSARIDDVADNRKYYPTRNRDSVGLKTLSLDPNSTQRPRFASSVPW